MVEPSEMSILAKELMRRSTSIIKAHTGLQLLKKEDHKLPKNEAAGLQTSGSLDPTVADGTVSISDFPCP